MYNDKYPFVFLPWQEVHLSERQHRPRPQGRVHCEGGTPGLLRVHVPPGVAVRAAQGVPQQVPAHGRAPGMVGPTRRGTGPSEGPRILTTLGIGVFA